MLSICRKLDYVIFRQKEKKTQWFLVGAVPAGGLFFSFSNEQNAPMVIKGVEKH